MMKKQTKFTVANIEKMAPYEISRWAALQEAMDIIGDKCEERGIDFNKVDIKPLEIQRYVDHASDNIFQVNFGRKGVEVSEK